MKENTELKKQMNSFEKEHKKQNEDILQSLHYIREKIDGIRVEDAIKEVDVLKREVKQANDDMKDEMKRIKNEIKESKIEKEVVAKEDAIAGEVNKDLIKDIIELQNELSIFKNEIKEEINTMKSEIREEFDKKIEKETASFEKKIHKIKEEIKEDLIKDRVELQDELNTLKIEVKKANIEIYDEIKMIKRQGVNISLDEKVLKKRDEIKDEWVKETLEFRNEIKLFDKLNNDIDESAKALPKQSTLTGFLTIPDEKFVLIDQIDMQNLKKWIPKPTQALSNSSLKLQLIYRGSRDGFGADIFHKKCDNITPNITVIKSEYGRVFGGYTVATWEGNSINKNDSTAFLFSLTNQEIYPHNGNGRAICGSTSYLTLFGNGSDLYLTSNCNSQASGCAFPTSYSCARYSTKSTESCVYLAGAERFKVDEVELYKVIWE